MDPKISKGLQPHDLYVFPWPLISFVIAFYSYGLRSRHAWALGVFVHSPRRLVRSGCITGLLMHLYSASSCLFDKIGFGSREKKIECSRYEEDP